MNVQTLDLKQMSLTPLSEFELQEVDGGSLLSSIAGLAGVIVSQAAIVTGLLTLNPELVYLGAVGTGLSLNLID